jgi:ABC-2 type transport system permease protein
MIKKQWKETTGLIRELAITEFKLKYQGSAMSYLWSLLKPLASFLILYIVFVKILKTGIEPEVLFLGIVLWSYFADFTSGGLTSIVEHGDLLRKVYFPRAIIVIATSVSAFITLLLNLLAVGVFMIITRTEPSVYSPLLLVVLVELYIFALGITLILSSLYVKFRDISHIWEVVLQLLFYSSAILYPLSAVPKGLVNWMALNPVVQIVQDARRALLDPSLPSSFTVIDRHWLAIVPYLLPFIIFTLGVIIFSKSSKNFAENV